MQLVANDALVRSRVRIAGFMHLAAFAVLLLGLFASFSPDLFYFYAASLFVGIVLLQLAQFNLRRWGPRHRQDGVLREGLKGLDNRYSLITFAAPELPDYLLASPRGMTVLVARPNKGTIVCRKDRWSYESGGPTLLRLFRTALGNPTADAASGIENTRRYLTGKLNESDWPVDAVIVFTSPDARLRIEGSTYPVTTLKELRNHLRRVKGNLNQAEVNRLQSALTAFAQVEQPVVKRRRA
jgi:hypothetical protein